MREYVRDRVKFPRTHSVRTYASDCPTARAVLADWLQDFWTKKTNRRSREHIVKEIAPRSGPYTHP